MVRPCSACQPYCGGTRRCKRDGTGFANPYACAAHRTDCAYRYWALTSGKRFISIHETGVAFLMEQFTIQRHLATWIITLIGIFIAILCSLLLGDMPFLTFAGHSLFDILDKLISNFILPIGALLTCLFVGWFLPKSLVMDEVTNHRTTALRIYPIFLFCIRFICPILILAIFLHQLGLF